MGGPPKYNQRTIPVTETLRKVRRFAEEISESENGKLL